MVIVRSQHLDWEPLLITITSSNQTIDVSEMINSIDDWIDDRRRTPLCSSGCSRKVVAAVPRGLNIDVLVQWMCEECLPKLLKFLSAKYPQIAEARLGESPEPPGQSLLKDSTVQVPSRGCTVEDGREIHLPAFRISSSPVCVGAYEQFSQESGYVTLAERGGHHDNYRSNGLLDGLDTLVKKEFPAKFLSFVDAIAYCQHYSVRLPTNEELLAAITIDDAEHDLTEGERARIYQSSRIPRPAGWTLTASIEADKIIIRRGPWVAKHPGWAKGRPSYRQLVDRDACVCQFYVCTK